MVLWFLFSLDKRLSSIAQDETRRELARTKPSSYERSVDEVNRAEARAAFLDKEPAQRVIDVQGGSGVFQ